MNIFRKSFCTYIKMPKSSSAEYYQDDKESLQKRLAKDKNFFLKKKKKTSDNMVVKDTKIFQKTKSKSWFSIDKDVIK